MSLLGYLIPRIASTGVEPAATLALDYLLNASKDVAQAFVDVVGRTGIATFTPGRIVAEEQHGDHFPDLTIRDADGVVRILVENKFWAGLTDAQPVAYLEALPDETPSVLVFIVPHQRMYGLWGELSDRCGRNAIELGSQSSTDAITWARAGHRILAITSWKHVLGTLEQAAADGGHAGLRHDIVQLRGLTDQMNAGEFLPLREDEVTDVKVARRLINYSDLIEEIVGRLVADGIASTKGLRPTHSYTSAGRYLRVHGKFGLWLGVDLMAWRDWGITPIWSEHSTTADFSGIEGKVRQAERLFDNAHEAAGCLYIPVRLTTGADRDRVIDDAVRQMRSVADQLLEAFPAG
ncbi:MAG: hypothetical protein OXI92_09530 [Acidobacteriota bacterium]|nr:hypothetical protein [Acidobacteriota bacterium]